MKNIKDDVKGYSMSEALTVGEVASEAVREYLESLDETVSVVNVENDKEYQAKDIDYIWYFIKDGKKRFATIEVKGDRYSHTGNFFLETVSNTSKNTPGCFLYSEADYFFYYFVDIGELNVIPLPETRNWFLQNKHKFKEVATSTVIPHNGERYYSLGKLVPKKTMRKEIARMKYKFIQ